MKLKIDPTLHIIDTESDFILTTPTMNLAFNLALPERQRVYELLNRLKAGEDMYEDSLDSNQFEAKLIKVLINKGIATFETEEKQKEEKGEGVSFKAIYAPSHFLKIIHKELGSSWELAKRDNDAPTSISTYLWYAKEESESNRSINKVYLYIFEDCMYLSTEERPMIQEGVDSEVFLAYAAYVFLDKLKKGELNQITDEVVLKIDLSYYMNHIQQLAAQRINEELLLTSILAEPRLTGHQIHLDYESYFPLVLVEYRNPQHSFYALGFDQHDALRNLLFLIEEQGVEHRIQRGTGYKKEFELNKESFLQKYMSIYFEQEDVELRSLEGGKEMICAEQKYWVQDWECCANSLLLTLFLNSRPTNKGVVIHENEIIRS